MNTFKEAHKAYEAAKRERSHWVSLWQDITRFLLPSRGIYDEAKPTERNLTSPAIVNNMAGTALQVLVSGMHGGLTSPSLPWFKLEWRDQRIQKFEPLKAWMQDCNDKMHTALQTSNFYGVISGFYTEYAGFGTGCLYVGEDTYNDLVPCRYELLTVGEYAYSFNAIGELNTFFRLVYRSPQQLVDVYKDKVSDHVKRYVIQNLPDRYNPVIPVLEVLERKEFMGKKVTRWLYEYLPSKSRDSEGPTYLAKDSFFEFPYFVARWEAMGSDLYGTGPGTKTLADIKRLQEMEKSFLMAVHKSVDPPVNAPSYMRSKIESLPGGINYYRNPNDGVRELYQLRFDLPGVSGAIERVENRIQRGFFNDIFLTGARDPDASPYKAAEVVAREQERMLRLGPVIERLQSELYQPLLERVFNIMLRKEMFDALDPKLAAVAGDYQISLISPLATAQRGVALQGINSFLSFIGSAAQFDQTILDNVDVDQAARHYGEITGVHYGILRTTDAVKELRDARAKMMAEEKAKQEAAMIAQIGSELSANQASVAKAQAEAGKTLTETQNIARQTGVL